MDGQVLVVENEEIVAFDLEMCLASMGYNVAIVTTGEEAVATANRLRPDVVIMDINLEGSMDGICAAASIRRETGIPLIFLTAYASYDTIERAVAVDPAGYIVKPFNEKSLAANIRIALNRRRREQQASASAESRRGKAPVTTAGNLRIDNIRYKVFRGEIEIALTKKELSILQCLAEQSGVPMTSEDLLTKAWWPQFVHYIQALRVHVGHLRQKIGRHPGAGVLIETVRGVGYRLFEADPVPNDSH